MANGGSKLLRAAALTASLLLFGALGNGIAAQAKPAWQQEWEKTLEAAKKEGQVAIYIGGYESILPDFEKDYPEIKVIPVVARGADLVQRVLSERRADKYLADVVSSGANATTLQLYPAKVLDPMAPALILPEVTDESKWYLGKHQYYDPERRFVFNYVGSANYGDVNYNTNLVDPKEIKSYWDLLQPKWKDKIVVRDVRAPGPGGGTARFLYHHPALGAPYIRKLYGEMNATLFRDFRQGPDWLAVGKFALCFFCDADKAKMQGLPVDLLGLQSLKEGGGLVQQFGTLGLFNRAPHPNAAIVFINWLLSRRGQIALQKRTAIGDSPSDSLRIDIPKDDVPMQYRRQEGVKYVDTGKPEMLNMKPILEVINDALKAGGKS